MHKITHLPINLTVKHLKYTIHHKVEKKSSNNLSTNFDSYFFNLKNGVLFLFLDISIIIIMKSVIYCLAIFYLFEKNFIYLNKN